MKFLRKRLTLLYTITTGLILTVALTVFFLFQVRVTRQKQMEDFYAAWDSICLHLQSDTLLSHSFLAQMETANRSIIYIEENGIPLLYPGSWTPATNRFNLILQVKELAGKEGILTDHAPVSSSSATSTLLTVHGSKKDTYYAMVMVFPYKNGVRSLCFLSCLPSLLESMDKTVGVLLCLNLAGILSFWLVSWHFVGWSLRPVEESRKKQNEFMAAASHELRSPLAVLRSGIAAIQTSPDKQESLLHTLDSECIRMAHLIDDMLLLSLADAQSWKIQPQKIDMDTLLIETYEAFLPFCRQKPLSLHLDLPQDPLPPLIADPERLRQILLILLDNALCHTPEGKEILIQAYTKPENHPKFLILQVIDQGCGIPDCIKPYIFDRFYRADTARRDKTHFGLGLSIAKELTALHKGTITIKDNPLGGSCFVVTLPVC